MYRERWWVIWKIGHVISYFFLPSCDAFSASFILFWNSSSVSSRSSKPSGGAFFEARAVRRGGMTTIGGVDAVVSLRGFAKCLGASVLCVCLGRCFRKACAHPQLSEDAARASDAKLINHRAASSLHSKLGEDSSSATPPTWSSTLPTLPSARAHVRTTPDPAIGGNGALTRTQRSTGLMRRRGSSTATGTGCDRYVCLRGTSES
jgi:hypothetical protein